jgi:tetratricopeptide (TPR) repeat protein
VRQVSFPPGTRAVIVTLLSLGALSGATTVLATHYRDARAAHARGLFERAAALSSAGRLEEATRSYRAGLALERDDFAAQRALALTLLSLGRGREAEAYLSDLLRQAPTDGPMNRGMARLAAREGRRDEATTFYQRAIYGQWPDEMRDARIDTRFELIELLRRSDAGASAAHAELLRLKADVPPERTAVVHRLAAALIEIGALPDAIDTLEAAAAAAPRDAGILDALGEAQAAAGRWRDARATLRRAVALDRSKDVAARLAVVERVVALDPADPQVGILERTRRARRLLAAVLEEIQPCAPPETAILQRSARAHLARRDSSAEAAERDLDFAAQLWKGAPGCHDRTVEARAIDRVLQGGTAVPAR